MHFKVINLGLVEYDFAYSVQRNIWRRVKDGELKATAIICRHYPSITLGRAAKRENLKAGQEELKKRGIKVYEADRGGDITYHGPGQLIVYPVVNLEYFAKDLRLFISYCEGLVIDLLEGFGIYAQRVAGSSGVWIGGKKIASLGIAIRNWVTYHGFAVNIHAYDLFNFSCIRPCGMDIVMASLEGELGREVIMSEVEENFTRRLEYDESYFASIRRGDC